MGFLIIISKEPVMEFSISFTSPLMRAMMSPFLSSEKNESGREVILWYTRERMSRTMPVRSGTMMPTEAK